jgi:hypothetical protein
VSFLQPLFIDILIIIAPTQDNDSQLETAFQLAEANESETSEDIEYSEDNLESSSSSEIIIK